MRADGAGHAQWKRDPLGDGEWQRDAECDPYGERRTLNSLSLIHI